jgi:hypothetical protein
VKLLHAVSCAWICWRKNGSSRGVGPPASIEDLLKMHSWNVTRARRPEIGRHEKEEILRDV